MHTYETVIGLEVHTELSTQTKIFCGCSTAFGAKANTQVCPVCLGMPGALPVLNAKVVEYAVAIGLALHCKVAEYSRFDRKNYFYPDNPQNYQISQLYLPICTDGYVEIQTSEGIRKIAVKELHMEEDAGKLVHVDNATLIDYNRAGVALIEIVSEPEMHTGEEVLAYLDTLKTMLKYLDVSDCKMQEGSLRVDVNLSVKRQEEKELGTRTEMKNLNSLKAVGRAIEAERKRQIALLEDGERIVQETRRWDDGQGRSYPMRSKEDAQDYRYFPEPDLGPILIDAKLLTHIREKQPELRAEKIKRFKRTYQLPDYDIGILTESREMADKFEETCRICKDAKKVSNWLTQETMRLMREQGTETKDLRFAPRHLAKLIALAKEGVITGTVAKEVFAKMFASDVDPAIYIDEKGLRTVLDEKLLRKVCAHMIAHNPQSVTDYKDGREKAIEYLVGQTMKEMKGKANPEQVKAILKELLI